MNTLVFYQQERRDRGVRTGISINGEPAWDYFIDGENEPDPSLLWFVELRCEGASLPDRPETARQWLLDHSDVIRNGFKHCAEERRAGVDPDIYPMEWDQFPERTRGVRMTIAFVASHPASARALPKILNRVARTWKGLLKKLEPLRPIVR